MRCAPTKRLNNIVLTTAILVTSTPPFDAVLHPRVAYFFSVRLLNLFLDMKKKESRDGGGGCNGNSSTGIKYKSPYGCVWLSFSLSLTLTHSISLYPPPLSILLCVAVFTCSHYLPRLFPSYRLNHLYRAVGILWQTLTGLVDGTTVEVELLPTMSYKNRFHSSLCLPHVHDTHAGHLIIVSEDSWLPPVLRLIVCFFTPSSRHSHRSSTPLAFFLLFFFEPNI